MANMSYCRLRNTLKDLQDCYDNMEDPDDLLIEERRARAQMIKLARDIVQDFGDED